MYKMRKIMAIIVLTALIFSSFSCAPEEEGGFFRRLDSPACFKVSGQRHGVAFSAEIEISEGEGRMVFRSPASLAGITVTTAGGVYNCALDGIAVEGIPAELLGAPISVFVSVGEARSAEKLKDAEGGALTLIVTATENGNVEYYIDSKSGFPVSVTEKDLAGETVMQLDITEYTIK